MPDFVQFPCVRQVISASYTLAHGITPCVATVDISPQPGFVAQGGRLVFSQGATRLVFDDCKVDAFHFERTSRGMVWRLMILDRRWKWAFGEISGLYNLRQIDGQLVDLVDPADPHADLLAATVKSPRELATLCLEAMGEQGYDVSQLPNDERPRVEWEHANPAQALAALCELLGCRVVLKLDGRVTLAPLGQGAALPNLPEIVSRSLSVDPPERPDSITVVGARRRWQVDLRLEAVAEDVDGKLKPIDDVSYKPAAGWSSIDLPHFHLLADPKLQELARRTVFRCYRIVFPFELPQMGTIRALLRIRPLDRWQVASTIEHGFARRRPAQVWGIWFDGRDVNAVSYPPVNRATQMQALTDPLDDYSKQALYARGFLLDVEQGLVQFHEPVYQLVAGNSGPTLAPATLALRTSIQLRDEQHRGWLRGERRRQNPANARFGTRSRIVRRDEIALASIVQYDYSTFLPTGETSNQVEVDLACDRHLDAVERDYQTRLPEHVTYAGLVPISPDGAIQQVTWQVSSQGVTTRAARNQEVTDRTIGYRERRFLERLRSSLQQPTNAAGQQMQADLAKGW